MRPIEGGRKNTQDLINQEALISSDKQLKGAHETLLSNDNCARKLKKLEDEFEDANELMEYMKHQGDKILDRHDNSEVAKFYAGRSIFITGASGFVGKCLLEKLLRSCSTLKCVYILMRPKRGVDIDERLETLLKSDLFTRLRNMHDGNKQLDKIKVIRGDITKPLFGICEHDLHMLSSQVSLVFHSAATVKFVEPLKVAVENNVVSVENLINFAHKLHSLEALVHVSTAYSNCDRKQVDEIFYETPINANKLIHMAEWMQSDMLERISPALLNKRPNTYTFTKAVAESLLVERSKVLLPNVPIAMIRPSIVAGIWHEPIRGWVDNFNGPTGVILSMMSGAIQAMLACPTYCADIVPVDIVANLIICAAWQVHKQHKSSNNSKKQIAVDQMNNENITIFNCVSGTLNPLAWRHIANQMHFIARKYPLNNMLRRPGFLLIPNELIFNVFNFLNHTIVAYTGDFMLKLMGKKEQLVLIYKRLMKMVETLKPFTTNQWLFKCTNVTCLYERLSPIDKELFNFDVRQVVWADYLNHYYVGAKIHALKDDPNTLPKARCKLNQMNRGSYIAQIIFLFIAYYFLLRGTSIEEYVIQQFAQLFSYITSIKYIASEEKPGINEKVFAHHHQEELVLQLG